MIITFIIILLFFAANLCAQITPGITSFNAGEVSSYVELRSDYEKYDNACKTLTNMLILSEGPVERRPGTKYIADVKDSSKKVRLIPFEYSKTDAYVLEMGDEYIRFYRNGGQILNPSNNPYTITSKFQESELPDIQYVQRADIMYLVDGNDPPQKLTRLGHASWTITDVNFVTGPFLDENITSTIIDPYGVTGTITITADANIFDPGHVGALWRIGHRRTDNPLIGVLDANESSSSITVGGDYDYNIQGTWTGDAALEKSFDNGVTWEAVYPRYNSGSAVNEDYDGVESEDNVLYRVTMTNFTLGTAYYYLRVRDYIDYGEVRIKTWVDANEVTATVLSTLTDTKDTTKWSEGAWSDYRGWPQTLEFHEQRLFFGGSASYPQTIWATKTAGGAFDDYENMTEGMDDDDALTYILPGQNPIQWMLSEIYLLIGTLSGVGRWGSDSEDTPITPTQPTNYREQSPYGSAYIQAVKAENTILYVERGGRRIREFGYSLESDSFISPDMTVLARHITGNGVINIAYQSRPDPLLWGITEDGDIATLTYQRAEKVIGWSSQNTDGDFESACVIPGTDEDEVWVSVKRTIGTNTKRYIEQFQPRDWGTEQEDCFFVDCGLSFDGGAAVNISNITKANPAVVTVATWPVDGDNNNLANGDQIQIIGVLGMTEVNNNIYTIASANVSAKTFALKDSTGAVNINASGFTAYRSGGTVQKKEKDFSNLSHLESETVSALADGQPQTNGTISGSAIHLSVWANKVHIGLPFTSQLETMPVVLLTQSGLTAGKKLRISSILVNFYKSLGVQYGKGSDQLDDVVFYDIADDIGEPIELYTGWRPLSFLRGYDRDATIYMEQSRPLPFCCRAICPVIEFTEK